MSLTISSAAALAQPTSLSAKLFIKKEQYRLKAHLSRTERALRRRSTDNLSPELKASRKRHLDSLRDYWQAGVFPLNVTHPGQTVPLLEDSYGTLCAMAHVISEDGHYPLIKQLSQIDNTVRIGQDTAGPLGDWIDQSGLTRDEARRIQPNYVCDTFPCEYSEVVTGTIHFSVILLGLAVLFAMTQFFLIKMIRSTTMGRQSLALIVLTIINLTSMSALGIGLYLLGVDKSWWLV